MTIKFKATKFTTPVGVAKYPKLNKPGKPFAEGDVPSYEVQLLYKPDQIQEFIDTYEALLANSFDAMKQELANSANPKDKIKAKSLKLGTNRPYKPEMDKETGEETGLIQLTLKLKSIVTPKDGAPFPVKPDIFDSKGAQLAIPPAIGGGSKLRVAGFMTPFNSPAIGVGLTLKMRSVQIVELVEYASSGGLGFDAVEGGYVAPELSDEEADGAAPDNSDF